MNPISGLTCFARISAALAGVVLLAGPVHGQASGNCDWTGAVNSDWHEAGNWDCGSHNDVPSADDAVLIAPGGATTVEIAADAEAWSLELGIDDGSSTHPNDHQLLTTVDNVTLTIGDGGVIVRQTGYFQPGKRQIFGIGSQSPQRANLESAGTVLVHGQFWPRNATITADVVLDQPAIGGARGSLQARAWNVIHGQLHVVSGFLQPVVPGGFYGSGAPHLRVVDNDLIVEDGSGVQFFADTGTITEAAIAVDGGIFDLRGSLSTSSFTNSADEPIFIDAETHNQGSIRVRAARPPGIGLRGPADTVHLNSGVITVGGLAGSDTEDDAVDGFGLLVSDDRSLHNTGQITIHRLRTAEGEVSNTDGGTIADEIEVPEPGTYILGFAGDQAVEIEVVDTGTDPIERLTMTWHGEDHADAALHPQIAGTAHWWDLAATTAGGATASGDLSLSLPRLDFDVTRVCCYEPSLPEWDCLPTDNSPTRATVYGLSTLSQWAMADYPDLLFSDRFEQP